MPLANVTATAKTGPAVQLTAKVFNGVSNINIDLDSSVISLTLIDGRIQELDYYGMTTVTYTISGQVATVTFS